MTLRSWVSMHLVGKAALCWAVVVLVSGLSPGAEVPLPLQVAGGRTAPVALLVPLLCAAGTQFAMWHDGPWLARLASRALWREQVGWAICCLLPALLLTAVGAWYSDRITVGAGVRSCLVFTGISLLASWRLPPGIALVPAAALALVSLVLVNANALAQAQAWNWLAQVRSSPAQLAAAVALWSAAVISVCLRRPRP